MSSNKSAKEALIARYGKQCFIERLKLRDTSNIRYTGTGQYKRMKQLTYHHIKERCKGGQATIENGALLSAENHQWFNQQSREKQQQMNNMFQELKRQIDYQKCKVEITTDIQIPFEIVSAEISIDNNGKIDMKKLKRKEKRDKKRELQKLKKEWEDR